MSSRRIATPLKYTPVANAAETGLISPDASVVTITPKSRATGIPPAVTNTPRYSPLTSNSPRTTPRVMNTGVLAPIIPPQGSTLTPAPGTAIAVPVPFTQSQLSLPHSPTLAQTPASIAEEADTGAEEKFQFFGGGEEIKDPVVENELIKSGYLPTQKIMINEGSQKQCMFIKATNKFGQPVLIKLDDEGVVVESQADLTIVKSNVGQIGDYSSRVGERVCMQSEACGLAYVCNNGVCVMENDNSGKIIESKFEFVKRFSEQDAIIGDEPVAYPVVSLSDIRANPALVLDITNKATKRLRNAAYNNSTQSLIDVRNNIEKLNLVFNEFLRIRGIQEKRLMESIKILEGYIVNYERLCLKVESQVELQKHKEVIANLTLRNEKVTDLLRAVRSVTDINTSLLDIINNINESTRFLCDEFQQIDTAYAL